MKKKSNKIFFAFLILLPLMMVVFNLLLKAQYTQGNLHKREKKPLQNIERPLKPFRHLVLNGKPVVHLSENPLQFEIKRFELEAGPQCKPHLALNASLDRFVKERYSNDTLYLTYEIDRFRSRDDLASYDNRLLKLYVPSLASLTVRHATLEAPAITQKVPLKVFADDARSVTFTHMELPALSVSSQRSYVNFSRYMKVDSLWYEAIGHSAFFFNVPHQFGKIVQGGMDPMASVSITGESENMQTYLNRQ